MTTARDIGARLKEARESLGASQAEMAEKLGTSERSYQRYETGQRELDADQLAAFALLGFDVHWLLTGEGGMRRAPTASADELLRGVQAGRQGLGEAPSGRPAPPVLDESVLRNAIVAVLELAEELNVERSAEDLAEAVLLFYREEMKARGEGKPGISGAEVVRLFRRAAG